VSELTPGSIAAEPQVEELLAVLGLVGRGKVRFGPELIGAVGESALFPVLAVPLFPVATQLGLVLGREVVRLRGATAAFAGLIRVQHYHGALQL